MAEDHAIFVDELAKITSSQWFTSMVNGSAEPVLTSALGGIMSDIVLRDINIQAGMHHTSCLNSLPMLSSMTRYTSGSLALYQFMLTVAESYIPINVTERHKYLNLELFLPNLPTTWKVPEQEAEAELLRRFILGDYKWAN